MDSETIKILKNALLKTDVLGDEIHTRVKSHGLRDILDHKSTGIELQIKQAIEILSKGSWLINLNSVVYIDDKAIRKSLEKSFE